MNESREGRADRRKGREGEEERPEEEEALLSSQWLASSPEGWCWQAWLEIKCNIFL
jgi:hypothetical protein